MDAKQCKEYVSSKNGITDFYIWEIPYAIVAKERDRIEIIAQNNKEECLRSGGWAILLENAIIKTNTINQVYIEGHMFKNYWVDGVFSSQFSGDPALSVDEAMNIGLKFTDDDVICPWYIFGSKILKSGVYEIPTNKKYKLFWNGDWSLEFA